MTFISIVKTKSKALLATLSQGSKKVKGVDYKEVDELLNEETDKIEKLSYKKLAEMAGMSSYIIKGASKKRYKIIVIVTGSMPDDGELGINVNIYKKGVRDPLKLKHFTKMPTTKQEKDIVTARAQKYGHSIEGILFKHDPLGVVIMPEAQEGEYTSEATWVYLALKDSKSKKDFLAKMTNIFKRAGGKPHPRQIQQIKKAADEIYENATDEIYEKATLVKKSR